MILPRHPQGAADAARHYDELDWLYRELWGEHIHHGLWSSGRETPTVALEQLVKLVAERATIGPGTTVVDVGCGYGATARLLQREYGAEVTAITVSRAQYEYARRKSNGDLTEQAAPTVRRSGSVTYLLGDWLENDLPSSACDAVIAIESTEHIADKAQCFAEALRVLRPGGRLVVCAWLAGQRPRRWQVRHLLEPICREGRLAGMGTVGEYRDLLARAGLELIGFEDLSRRVRRTWSICIGRSVRKLLRDRRYRLFLRDARNRERIFALTPIRLWLAYRAGAMRYGMFTARKPSGATPR